MNEASNDKPTNNMIKNIEPILEKTAGFSSRFGFHFASSLGSIMHDFVDLANTLGGFWDHSTVRKGAFVHFVDLGYILDGLTPMARDRGHPRGHQFWPPGTPFCGKMRWVFVKGKHLFFCSFLDPFRYHFGAPGARKSKQNWSKNENNDSLKMSVSLKRELHLAGSGPSKPSQKALRKRWRKRCTLLPPEGS